MRFLFILSSDLSGCCCCRFLWTTLRNNRNWLCLCAPLLPDNNTCPLPTLTLIRSSRLQLPDAAMMVLALYHDTYHRAGHQISKFEMAGGQSSQYYKNRRKPSKKDFHNDFYHFWTWTHIHSVFEIVFFTYFWGFCPGLVIFDRFRPFCWPFWVKCDVNID